MKIILLTHLLLLSASFCFGQHDSTESTINISEVNTIWKAAGEHFPLKKGFYKNYQEFLTNSPSILREFKVIEKTKSQAKKDKGICAVNFDLDKGQDKVGKVWGFSDGEAVYFKASFIEGKYWKVEYIAPYSYFIHIHQAKTPASLLSGAIVGFREFSIINSKGKWEVATYNYMKKILKKCPGLVEEYAKEPNSKDEEVKKSYLKRANDFFAQNPTAL